MRLVVVICFGSCFPFAENSLILFIRLFLFDLFLVLPPIRFGNISSFDASVFCDLLLLSSHERLKNKTDARFCHAPLCVDVRSCEESVEFGDGEVS